MIFEWDEDKNRKNIQKHGIDFNDAKEVFQDQNRLTSPDLRKDYGEIRWKTIGNILGLIFSVIFTLRNSAVRIISARKASKKERDEYLNQ
jgi:uncharacterized protein